MGNRLRLNEKQFSPTWLRAARPGIIDETWSHLVRDSATSILIMEDFRGCGSCGRLHRPEKNTQCIHIPWRHLSPELTVDLKRIKCLKWRSVLNKHTTRILTGRFVFKTSWALIHGFSDVIIILDCFLNRLNHKNTLNFTVFKKPTVTEKSELEHRAAVTWASNHREMI